MIDEIKVQAMCIELEAQRSVLGTRAAQLAADLAVANQRIQVLEEQVAQQGKKREERKETK